MTSGFLLEVMGCRILGELDKRFLMFLLDLDIGRMMLAVFQFDEKGVAASVIPWLHIEVRIAVVLLGFGRGDEVAVAAATEFSQKETFYECFGLDIEVSVTTVGCDLLADVIKHGLGIAVIHQFLAQ